MAFNQYAQNEAQNIALGQKGSVLAKTDAVTAIGGVFVAIQFIEDSVFESGSTGLVAETTQLFPDDTGVSSSVSASNGDVILYDNKPVGRITTTRYSYHLKQFIGLAWIPVELANPGNILEIIHDDKSVECEIVEGAFYDPSGDKMRS